MTLAAPIGQRTELPGPGRPVGDGSQSGGPASRSCASLTSPASCASAPGPTPTLDEAATALSIEDVTVSFGSHVVVRSVTLDVPAHKVTTLLGPSGCGKTTVLRAVNRLHDRDGGRVKGRICLGDLDVYGPATRPEAVRSRVGMVFQKPNPFPTMSIFDNVVSGLRFAGVRKRAVLQEAAELALRQAALWELVRDRLDQPALRLSGGQQQRLCIARALAVAPEVLLMDEPCSALDPIATAKVEHLVTSLALQVTVVLVTHNMFQAARVSDHVAVMLMAEDRVGELVEAGPARHVLQTPRDPRARDYLSGRVG
ncbi:MAG: phosphate ABC transporter ATP-binding protein [Acidimicrobiales bacterium]